ncbi:MAG: glycosyltransferase, partial [Chitinophagaceae bacterium]
LDNYDLYLISSSYEGFGIALLEAMATGIPALVSDIPVFREVASDTVLYFSLEQPAQLAQALRAIYEGKISLTGHSLAGQKQAAKIASSESYLKSLNSIYKKYS